MMVYALYTGQDIDSLYYTIEDAREAVFKMKQDDKKYNIVRENKPHPYYLVQSFLVYGDKND